MNAPATVQTLHDSDVRATLLARFDDIRNTTTGLTQPLAIEDYVIQSSPDCSPAKWHLAHTTWFFENFLLIPELRGYVPFHAQYGYLFNSYYETVGTFFPRPLRGMLSRPTVDDIHRYRGHVDHHMRALLERLDPLRDAQIIERITLGLHHEQQHQELLLTDIKNLLALNPMRPAYAQLAPVASTPVIPTEQWREFPAGMYVAGSDGAGFCFDNETPRHRVFLDAFSLAPHPVTNGEYLQFIAAGGYDQASLWLSDGWRKVREAGRRAPLDWEQIEGEWGYMTLHGIQRVDPCRPVCHVSYFEADAFARWAGKRLPTELEWEVAAAALPLEGNFLESGALQPTAAANASHQMFGDVWEWTSSAYLPYPNYRPLPGSLGEYNGKFMIGQMVLRGGSCITPRSHMRATYRNFFYPPDRWQFMGIRLAR